MSQSAPHRASNRSSRGRKKASAKAGASAAPAASVVAPILEVESLDMEARGVGRTINEDGTPGKVIFVEGALPGERVTYLSYRDRKSVV